MYTSNRLSTLSRYVGVTQTPDAGKEHRWFMYTSNRLSTLSRYAGVGRTPAAEKEHRWFMYTSSRKKTRFVLLHLVGVFV